MTRAYHTALIIASLGLSVVAKADPASGGGFELDVKRPRAIAKPNFYGSLELRHYTNAYYDADDYYQRQDPSFHVLGRVGATLYGGKVDAFATAGFLKLPGTRTLIQRRSEIEVDYYPITGNYGHVVLYNVVELPSSESRFDPENDKPERHGAIYTVGVSPLFSHPVEVNGAGLRFMAGLNLSTELFSRKQTVDTDPTRRDERSAYFLAKESDGDPVEDTAPHYFSEAVVGMAISPAFLRNALAEFAVAYQVEHHPDYRFDGAQVTHRYQADPTSYYKARFQYDIDSDLSLVNDFYHFHEGFFAGKVKGVTERRYRNIFKLVAKL